MPPRVVGLLAAHVTERAQVEYLRSCLQTAVRGQTSALDLALLSWSASESLRSAVELALGEFVGDALDVIGHSSRLSHFQHFEALSAHPSLKALVSQGDPVWAIFSDGGDLWHPDRVVEYRRALRASVHAHGRAVARARCHAQLAKWPFYAWLRPENLAFVGFAVGVVRRGWCWQALLAMACAAVLGVALVALSGGPLAPKPARSVQEADSMLRWGNARIITARRRSVAPARRSGGREDDVDDPSAPPALFWPMVVAAVVGCHSVWFAIPAGLLTLQSLDAEIYSSTHQYFDIIIEYEALCGFFAKRTTGVLAHRFCDRAFLAYTRHLSGGKCPYFEPQCWMYFHNHLRSETFWDDNPRLSPASGRGGAGGYVVTDVDRRYAEEAMQLGVGPRIGDPAAQLAMNRHNIELILIEEYLYGGKISIGDVATLAGMGGPEFDTIFFGRVVRDSCRAFGVELF